MKTHIVAVLLTLATALGGTVQATPLTQLRGWQVSELEFGSFKLEVALSGLKEWPFPIKAASVSSRADPDDIEIVIAVAKVDAASFRTACEQTIGRVREFLYVGADGTPTMARSYLSSYFRGRWRGPEREIALRAVDAITRIRVDVIGQGSCQAALIKAPITFTPISPR